MRMLAIETATEACSVALFEGTEVIGHSHEVLGRGHAERLVPMISELPEKGRAEQIRVSLGPGSFTGTRIGIAVARALGIAWKAEVLGYPTLQLVALRNSDQAMEQRTRDGFLVCMHGGHGEWFVQKFNAHCDPVEKPRSMAPEDAVATFDEHEVLGTRALEFVDKRGLGEAHHILPDARYAHLLKSDSMSKQVSPVYGRPPDARKPL